MKYSLRSLMIAVAVLAVVCFVLTTRSRYFAKQAEFYSGEKPTDEEIHEAQSFYANYPNPLLEIYIARLRFRHERYAAYERVSRMPWLPLLLPEDPPEYPPGPPDVNSSEVAAQLEAIFANP